MMLAQAKRREKIECHRVNQIVIFWRADVRAVMRVARLQARPQIFPVVRRSWHITSLVSECRGRNPLARLLVYREIQVHLATGRIDRYASVAVCGKEMHEVYRRRVRPLRPGCGTISR